MFTVKLKKGLGLLHNTVELRCGNVVIVSDSDEQGLAAAPSCKKELSRGKVRVHADGMGAMEIVDSQSKGLVNCLTLPEIMFYLEGNNLGVCGYFRCDGIVPVFIVVLKLKEIIDISVKADMDDAAFMDCFIRWFIIHRVTVGLGDIPH